MQTHLTSRPSIGKSSILWCASVLGLIGLGLVGVAPASALAVGSKDFAVSLSPNRLTLNAGSSATVRVSVTRGRKFRSALTYEAVNTVSGVGTVMQLSGRGANLNITATANAPSTNGQIVVRVSGGGRVKSIPLAIQIIGSATPPPQTPPPTQPAPTTKPVTGEFAIVVDQPTVSVNTGATAVVAVLVNATGGYVGSPTFGVTGAPAGVAASFVNASSPFGTNMLVTVSGAATRGDYTLVVTGTDGARVRQATVLLKITATSLFTLFPAFDTTRTAPGTAVTLKVAVAGIGGLPAPDVDVTIGGLPNGATSSPAVVRTNTVATFTITFASTTPEADIVVGVSGVSGSYAVKGQAAIRVSAKPLVSLATTDQTVTQGQTALYEIVYTPANGISQPAYVIKGAPVGTQSGALGVAATGKFYVQIVTSAATPKGVYALTFEAQSGAAVTQIPFTLRVV
jgi:hypothetical protein